MVTMRSSDGTPPFASARQGLLAATPTASKIGVMERDGKGRGVVALEPISAGEVVEQAPVLIAPLSDHPFIEKTLFVHYVYRWDDTVALALGFGSLYNHSFLPNLVYRKLYGSRLIEYRALRDIAAGEELCINYNGDPADRSPMPFPVCED